MDLLGHVVARQSLIKVLDYRVYNIQVCPLGVKDSLVMVIDSYMQPIDVGRLTRQLEARLRSARRRQSELGLR